MKLYVQFMIILIFSFIGEAISNLLNLPVPGSIIGLVLLFLALEFKVIRLRHIDVVGNFLLNNMTILFLPAAVGIMDRFNDIKDYLLPITIIILVAIFWILLLLVLLFNLSKHALRETMLIKEVIMTNILTNPIFGIMLSILAYLMGMLIFRRFSTPNYLPFIIGQPFLLLSF